MSEPEAPPPAGTELKNDTDLPDGFVVKYGCDCIGIPTGRTRLTGGTMLSDDDETHVPEVYHLILQLRDCEGDSNDISLFPVWVRARGMKKLTHAQAMLLFKGIRDRMMNGERFWSLKRAVQDLLR